MEEGFKERVRRTGASGEVQKERRKLLAIQPV